MAERIARREAIGMIGAAGAALAFGCQHSSPTTPTDTGTGTTTGGPTNAACVVTPSETVSPYPSLTHLVRSDIREGKPGTQLTLTIKVVNTNTSCGPIAGANVEIRQCDAAGNYSQYGTQTTQTYLRGIQTTNANGEVTFVTVYPGWYQGRATHMHVEVVRDGASVKVTQIAFLGAVNVACTERASMPRAAPIRRRARATASSPTVSIRRWPPYRAIRRAA